MGEVCRSVIKLFGYGQGEAMGGGPLRNHAHSARVSHARCNMDRREGFRSRPLAPCRKTRWRASWPNRPTPKCMASPEASPFAIVVGARLCCWSGTVAGMILRPVLRRHDAVLLQDGSQQIGRAHV